MEKFNSNDSHREDELFQSESEFQLNLSLRSNFRVPALNSTTLNSSEAAIATNQDKETLLTSQANESQSQPCTRQENSEREKDELIFLLKRKLAEKTTQLFKANEEINSLQVESEKERAEYEERFEKAGKNINDLKKELKEKKGQLVNFVLAEDKANKVEKFLTTVSGELGTFVKKLSCMVVQNVPQIESKFLVLGPFQTRTVKNEFIQLINQLATHISTNSATVEVVRDFLVNINTVINRQVPLTQDAVLCSPQPENLTSNPTANEIFRQEEPSTKRVCKGIRQPSQTAPSTHVPNSHLLINPPPLIPTIRPTPSSSSSTHKQSTFKAIRATPSSSGNHAQYTLQIMETTSFSSFAQTQSTIPHMLTPPSLTSSTHAPQPMIPSTWASPSSSTHEKSVSSNPWGSPSTHAQARVPHTRDATANPSIPTISLISPPLRDTTPSFSTHTESISPHAQDATSTSSTHEKSFISNPWTSPISPPSTSPQSTIRDIQEDETSNSSIQTISLISPTGAATATSSSSTHSKSVTQPTRVIPSSSTHVYARILPILAAQSSSIHTQSIHPSTCAVPSSSAHGQSTISYPWTSSSSPSTPTQSIIPTSQTALSTIPLIHVVPNPLQPLEVNSLTPLNHNGRSPPSINRSTLYNDQGLDLTSSETKHGTDHSSQLDNVCLCGGTFRTKATLKMHIQNHTTEGNFECDICKRRFHYPSVVKEHMMSAHKVARRHNDQRLFICYICQKDDLGSWEEFQEHLYIIQYTNIIFTKSYTFIYLC